MKASTNLAGKTVLIKSLKKLKKGNTKVLNGQAHFHFNEMTYIAGKVIQLGGLLYQGNYNMNNGIWSISPWMVEAIVKCPKEPKPDADKDWRDAFLEDTPEIGVKALESSADAIKINRINICTIPAKLCSYVGLFKRGGFWYANKGLYFVTEGVGSDPKATYQHAKNFIKNYEIPE